MLIMKNIIIHLREVIFIPSTKQQSAVLWNISPLTDLRFQFGVRVRLSAPDADLHDAIHVLLDELVVVQQLHSLSRSLRSVLLKWAQQCLSQVVQVVQVNCPHAAQRPAGARQKHCERFYAWHRVRSQKLVFHTHFKLMCEASSWTMRECLLVEEFLPSQLGNVGNWVM